MKHHSSFVIGLSLVLVLLLAACSPAVTPSPVTEAPTEVSDPATEAPAEEPTATPEPTPEAITIVDGLGRTVTLEALPQRIAITGKAHFMITDAVYFFPEAVERVAALSKSQQTADKAFVELLDPDYEAKAIFDSDSGPEQIAAAQPDLVLLKSSMAQGMGAAVEELGIPSSTWIWRPPSSTSAIWRSWDRFSATRPAPRRSGALPIPGRSNGSDGRSRSGKAAGPAHAVRRKQRGGRIEGSPCFLDTNADSGDGRWSSYLERDDGGRRMGGGEPGTDRRVDPDQIFIVNYFGNVDETVAALMADPKWEGLKAVQNEQIYGFPKDYYSWDQPDSRWYLGLTWLATKIQPEGFQADMGETFSDFYETFYGMDAAAVEESLVPLLEGKSW
jgi:iron complex transport system substrate-binding protein